MARTRKPRKKSIPNAVQRRPAGKPVVQMDMQITRSTWLLDLLAWARHGAVAPKIDLRGQRAALPPVILPVADGRLVAMEDAAAIFRLRSRHRAFSQIAARYSPLVVGAGDAGARIVLEIWDCAQPAADREVLMRIADQLATYLEADVTVHDLKQAQPILANIDAAALPKALLDRNPLAWQLALLAGGGAG